MSAAEVENIRMSKGEIIDALESEFRSEFGNDIDLTQSSVFSTVAEVMATVLSENQEQSLQEVYESGFLETAEGPDLDRVVAIVGLKRRSAVHATGVQRFISSSPVTTDYTVQRGTVVQTGGNDPRQYETTETVQLKYIDGFESGGIGAGYSGDTGDFSVVQDHPAVGAYELRASATSGSHVYSNVTIEEGTTLNAKVYPESNTVPIITFAVQDASNYYQVTLDSNNGEVRIEKVEDGSISQTIDTVSTSIPTDSYSDVEIDWNVSGQISATITSSDEEIASAGGYDSNDASNRWSSGYVGFKSGDANGQKYFDEVSTSAVSANIRAVNGGEGGNVGRNSIDVMPSPPAGVQETTNLYPTGDSEFIDKNGDPLSIGQPQETDEELRQRAKDSVSGGGDATVDAVLNTLLNEIEDVRSVNIYENKTESDNTGSGGLPPYSFEVVVYGGDDTKIAKTIFDKKALTSRDYGGAHGTDVTKTVQSDVTSDKFDISFSRPNALNISMTADIVVDDTYVGDVEIKDQIVSYIGGNNSDGATEIGLGVSENVHIDQIRDIVVGDDNGVIGFNSDITTTPSITTDSNGLDVIEVGQNEVGEVDVADITINTTEV